MTSKMDDIFKMVLNDKDIFSITKRIFNETEWSKLKGLFKNSIEKSKDNHRDFIQIVESKIESLNNEIKSSENEIKSLENRIKSLKNEMNKASSKNKKDFERLIESYKEFIKSYRESIKSCKKSIKLCNGLKSAVRDKPNVLTKMFDVLNSYELVQCNLPSMDDYGKVIERYSLSTVEQFFLDKIKRENDWDRKKALAKVLEYVKELYNCNQSVLEIAYFVRKLDSLTIFWEV